MNKLSIEVYDTLSSLLKYPQPGAATAVNSSLKVLQAANSPAAESIARFAGFVASRTQEEMEELFTQTFDINPVCALEVGWHLFGERYERGTFIVKMRETLRRLNLPESAELPDHISHVLEALGRMEPEEADGFAHLFVLPALTKMLLAQEGKDNPYTDVLEGICLEIKSRHEIPAEVASHE